MRRLAPLLVAPIALLAILLVVILATSEPAVDRQAASPLLGKPAPALVADTLDGGHFDLGAQRGRWVVVNYFAPWCIPCRQEHPELVSFAQRHELAGDAELVSVVYDDIQGSKDFFAQEGGDWPVVTDPMGRIALDWGVAKVPETFVVDPDGIVITRLISGVTSDGLDQLLAAAQQIRNGGTPTS
jgi:cytochrome c biogenesis protein CcmG/thiol:disulfide interchange protein DsbE